MTILGIDPGISGGFAFSSLLLPTVYAFKHYTPQEIADVLRHEKIDKAFLESVHSFPGQGVVSMFKFGENYGWWQGVLHSLKIPFERVTPLKWQTAMKCRTGGNKNVSKQRAQELFPTLKITHATADALLIAEYGRRSTRSFPGNDMASDL